MIDYGAFKLALTCRKIFDEHDKAGIGHYDGGRHFSIKDILIQRFLFLPPQSNKTRRLLVLTTAIYFIFTLFTLIFQLIADFIF